MCFSSLTPIQVCQAKHKSTLYKIQSLKLHVFVPEITHITLRLTLCDEQRHEEPKHGWLC